jgi:hypothetical protein
VENFATQYFSKSMAVIPLLVTADWVTRVLAPKHPQTIEKSLEFSNLSLEKEGNHESRTV